MKKAIAVMASLALLTGCQSSSFSGQVENGSEVVLTSNDNLSLTRQEIYETLAENYGANLLLNQALQIASQQEDIDEEELNNRVQETVDNYTSMMGDDLDSYAQQNLGYDTFEAYKEAVLVPSTRQQMMIEKYSEDNFETLATENSYRKLSWIKVADETTAMSVLAELNSGEKTFAEAVTEYSTDTSTSSSGGDLGVVSILSTDVDSSIANLTPQLTAISLYSVPVSLSDGSYAIIDVVETDPNNMKEEILEDLQSNETITSEAEAYYLNKYNFQVNEKILADAIKEIDENYLS